MCKSALVLAAGKGTRIKSNLPKYYIRFVEAREWLRPSQEPPGVLKFSSDKLM